MIKNTSSNALLIEKNKKELGKEIATLRMKRDSSQRGLASKVGLPPSNMKYVEDGVNAPSPDVYERIINTLKPTAQQRKKMDNYYISIRGTPPPDVCKFLIANAEINEAVRIIEGQSLSEQQLNDIKELFLSFKNNEKGDLENGKKL